MAVIFSGEEKARIADAAKMNIMTVDNWIRKVILDACAESERRMAKPKR